MQEWAPVFLKALRLSPNVSEACDAAGIGRTWAYECRKSDPEFAQAWNEAMDRSLDRLEARMFQRAEDTSDTLAIFLMKSHRPDLYGEKLRIEYQGTVELQWSDGEANQDASTPSGSDGGSPV